MTVWKGQSNIYKKISPDEVHLTEDTVILLRLQLEATRNLAMVKWSQLFTCII